MSLDALLSAAQREKHVRDWLERKRCEARADPNTFIEFCFRNDQDPLARPFKQQWFHREWQEAWLTKPVTVIHGATGFGKTEQKIGHYLWRMGKRPSIRILLLGKKQDNAKKLLRKIKRQIELNPWVRFVFPELTPGAPWTDDRLRLGGAGVDTTSDTVSTYGMEGSPQGERADIIDADDVIDFENTLTDYQRQKALRFIDEAIRTRKTTDGQFHMTVNAWHEEDVAFTYKKRPGVWYRCYPAYNEVTGELLWPDFRSMAWLEGERATLALASFERMYLCKPRSDSSRIFKEAWIKLARKKGAGLKPVKAVRHHVSRDGQMLNAQLLAMPAAAVRDEMRVVVGSDLATGKSERKRKTDLSVNFSIGVHANGDRQLLWIEKGRWSLDEKLERWNAQEARYRPEYFVVEDNGIQEDIVGFTQNNQAFGARVVAFNTGRQKWHESHGIEAIGVEMKAGRWMIPGPAEGESEEAYLARLDDEEREAYANINAWVQHLLDFSRVGHTPDDVMASYFAKEGVLLMTTGTFSHSKAAEMASPPPELAAQAQAGNRATVEALFRPAAQAAQAPAPAAPPPPPPPQAPPVPEHIRKLFGGLAP